MHIVTYRHTYLIEFFDQFFSFFFFGLNGLEKQRFSKKLTLKFATINSHRTKVNVAWV